MHAFRRHTATIALVLTALAASAPSASAALRSPQPICPLGSCRVPPPPA